jgi:hypothetical protein
MFTFSLCHTTARLPHGWTAAQQAWFDRCDQPLNVEYIVSVDKGRLDALLGAQFLDVLPPSSDRPPFWGRFATTVNEGRKSAVDGWNAAAAASAGRFLITVSDDYRPCEHWDTEILKALPEDHDEAPDLDGEYVLDVDNQDNSFPLLPFSFLTRAYYARLGHLFYPEFIGMMADNDFTDVARRDGVVVDARHLKFTHLHPHRGSAPDDDVYRWQQRPEAWEVGNRVYNRRVRERNAEPLNREYARPGESA